MAETSKLLGIAKRLDINSAEKLEVIESGHEYPELGFRVDHNGLITFSPHVEVIRQTLNQYPESLVITKGQFNAIKTGCPRSPGGEIRYIGPLYHSEIIIRPI